MIGSVQSRCHEGSTVGAVLNAYSPLIVLKLPNVPLIFAVFILLYYISKGYVC